MPYPKYRPLNRKKLKTISIKDRRSLVHLEDFPRPYLPGADFRSFIDSLPPYFAAGDLREFTDLLGEARKKTSRSSGAWARTWSSWAWARWSST